MKEYPKQFGYWKRQLAGVPPLELPTDRPRPPAQTHRDARQELVLPESLTGALKELSRREGATLFMVLLAAFQTLLSRYSSQEDIAVGTPIADRDRVEIEGLIGFFANALVLRGDLSGDPTFRELLGRVRETTLGAYAHQDLPFEKLVEELEPERDTSRTPLFQVMFALRDAPRQAPEPPGSTLSRMEVGSGTAGLDLMLSMVEVPEGLKGWLEYNAVLFEAATIERMLVHFRVLLEGAVADPGRRLSELPLLTEAECRRLLVEWNDTKAEYPEDKCVHELFEEQARRTPESVAVEFEGEQLTYRELNQRANQLARHLQTLGVGPEALVGICVERSLEMVVGILGILKAGGAYVPLDPAYPKERLAFMLGDARVPVLLTQERLLEELPEHGAKVVCLDSDREVITGRERENPAGGVAAENLAYVIYTSGSTGRPKGVMITHANLCHYVRAMQVPLEITADVRYLHTASIAFSSSVRQLMVPLSQGATVVVATSAQIKDPLALSGVIKRRDITLLDIVPSYWRSYSDTLAGLEPESRQALLDNKLSSILSASEPLFSDVAKNWTYGFKHGARLINMFGQTETTGIVAVYPIPPKYDDRVKVVLIGRPIANTQIYLLDQHLRPVPVGVPGELHIGGAGLARGYLNRPELTAEKFIPNPFGDEPGARLYKTGDLARYLPDGNIEFLGRIDHQIKIRGFRVELGEIEAVLSLYPAVREAVVLVREDEPGDKRLVAYVVVDRDSSPTTTELRGFLQEKLPEYMVPSAFVALEALPLTPNGKVERRALPAPDAARPELDEAFVPPRTALERFLAGGWQDVLGIERVGVHDNFFELGGDSIRGAIFLNRLQQALGEVISMATIFDAPTIAGLAVYLNQHYPGAVARLSGTEPPDGAERAQRIDATHIARIRRQTKPVPPHQERDEAAPKNPPAIFILSPPRSGSTLLRVMLGGHPFLFAPPELELLSFGTLAERKAALTGRYSFWLEGTIRAIMALKGCDAEEAKRTMEDWESGQLTTAQCYRIMQTWMGDRTLVDKTTSYPFNLETLKRAEANFDQALYIHLPRHPWAAIRSFEEARLDRIFLGDEHSFSARELAESIWLISHQNILEFLKDVPANRQYRLKYEELADRPRPAMEGLCRFLGLEFHPEMLQPYGDRETRMTDGIHPGSKMLGDPTFHQHRGIDAKVADRRLADATEDSLGDVTWQLAESLGYERPARPGEEPGGSSGERMLQERIPVLPRHSESGQPVVFPLSSAQQQLWFAEQLWPGNAMSNGRPAVHLRGPLDVAALEASLREICVRHEALRTTFDTRDGGEPVQVVGPPRPVPLTQQDLRELPPPAREAEAERLLIREARRPFDLSGDLMLRATLLRLDDEEHVLLLVIHHIVCDLWSLDVLFRELWTLYEASRSGGRVGLPELPVQYADYAVWQRRRLQDGALRQQMEYWKTQLADAPKVLDMPTDRPRPPARTLGSARQKLPMPASLLEELRALCRQQNVTLFVALLAAWAVLLHRYSGQDDILISTPFANRNRIDLEGVIGYFVNNLVLRHDLTGDPSFAELLEQVRETAVDAFSHNELPFDKVREELSLKLRAGFFLRKALRSSPKLVDGLRVEHIHLDPGGGLSVLDLSITEGDDRLAARIDYNADLFEASTVVRMLGYFQTLLESIVADPERRLSELPLPTKAERLRLATRRARGRLRLAARHARRRLSHATRRARRRLRRATLRAWGRFRRASGHVRRAGGRRLEGRLRRGGRRRG